MINITHKYLTDNECDLILKSLSDIDPHYWKPVVPDSMSVETTSEEELPKNVAVKVSAYRRFMGSILERLNLDPSVAVEVLKYPEGTNSPLHTDGKGGHFDNSFVVRNVTWSKTGIVLLNDNFEGGNLIFPKMNISVGKDYKSSLVEFTAGLQSDEYVHGVTPVTKGTRYTLVFRHE